MVSGLKGLIPSRGRPRVGWVGERRGTLWFATGQEALDTPHGFARGGTAMPGQSPGGHWKQSWKEEASKNRGALWSWRRVRRIQWTAKKIMSNGRKLALFWKHFCKGPGVGKIGRKEKKTASRKVDGLLHW